MRTFTRLVAVLSLLVVASFLAGGCSKKVGGGAKAFAAANPEIKTAWDKGLAEAKAKDYAAAIGALQDLHRKPGLTPDQIKAIEETMTAISDEMYAAANKGDAKAVEAIKILRERQRR
jgi:hypothetical protein